LSFADGLTGGVETDKNDATRTRLVYQSAVCAGANQAVVGRFEILLKGRDRGTYPCETKRLSVVGWSFSTIPICPISNGPIPNGHDPMQALTTARGRS
jgi:hypothetical protein